MSLKEMILATVAIIALGFITITYIIILLSAVTINCSVAERCHL